MAVSILNTAVGVDDNNWNPVAPSAGTDRYWVIGVWHESFWEPIPSSIEVSGTTTTTLDLIASTSTATIKVAMYGCKDADFGTDPDTGNGTLTYNVDGGTPASTNTVVCGIILEGVDQTTPFTNTVDEGWSVDSTDSTEDCPFTLDEIDGGVGFAFVGCSKQGATWTLTDNGYAKQGDGPWVGSDSNGDAAAKLITSESLGQLTTLTSGLPTDKTCTVAIMLLPVENEINITSVQTEDSEINISSLEVPTQIICSQTELSETNSAAVIHNNLIIATQIEASETNSASIQGPAQITSAQTETAETNSSLAEVFVSFTSTQTELSESQSGAINATSFSEIVSSQIEASESESARFLPGDYSEAFFTVDYADLNVDSIFYGNTTYSDLVIGDSFVHLTLSLNEGRTISMSGDGIVSISGGILPEDQTVPFFIHDDSDGTNGTPAILTIDAGGFIAAPQVEASDINTSALTVSAGFQSNISGVQTEGIETNTALVQLIDFITSAQIEASETQSAAVQNLSNILITSSQVEAPEINIAVLESLLTLVATQTEANEVNDANLIVVVPRDITASQSESSEINLASIENLIPLEWIEICKIQSTWVTKPESVISITRCPN